jgi:hypothetical protein
MVVIIFLDAVTEVEVEVRPVALLTAASTAEREEFQAVGAAAVEPPLMVRLRITTEAMEDEAKLGFGPTDERINTKKPSRTKRSGRTEGRLPAVRYGWLYHMD